MLTLLAVRAGAHMSLRRKSPPVQVLVAPAQRLDAGVWQCAGFQPRMRSAGLLRAGGARCVRAYIKYGTWLRWRQLNVRCQRCYVNLRHICHMRWRTVGY